LEKSLCDAKTELKGLRTKSSTLEEFCNLLNNEKHNLLNERNVLVSQLESVEANFGNLERRFTKLEEKYVNMEKDKESRVNQVEELHLLLLAQKGKVNELQFKLEAHYNFTNALEAIKKLRTKPKINDKYIPSFVIVDESVGNNTSDSLTVGCSKVLCDNKKLGSCVLLEDNGFELGKDSKWN